MKSPPARGSSADGIPGGLGGTRDRPRVPVVVRVDLGQTCLGKVAIIRIAAESGLAKTTLYRHWPTKAELVFDLVLREQELPTLAPTGSQARDRAALAERFVELLGSPVARRVFPGLLSDITADAQLRQRFIEAFIVPGRDILAPALDRLRAGRPDAGRFGEGLPGEPRIEDLQAVFLGSTFIWVHLLALPNDDVRPRLETLLARLLGATEETGYPSRTPASRRKGTRPAPTTSRGTVSDLVEQQRR